MSDTIDGAKLWCQVFVESRGTFTGYKADRFRAIAYAVGDGSLTFSLPQGTRKVFNWDKVLWFVAEEIKEERVEP